MKSDFKELISDVVVKYKACQVAINFSLPKTNPDFFPNAKT